MFYEDTHFILDYLGYHHKDLIICWESVLDQELKQNNTIFRKAIPPAERLAITLSLLYLVNHNNH